MKDIFSVFAKHFYWIFLSLQNSGHQIDSKSHINYGPEQPLPGMHKVKVKKNLLVRNIYLLITSWKIIQIESLQVNLLCYGPDKSDKNQINYMVARKKVLISRTLHLELLNLKVLWYDFGVIWMLSFYFLVPIFAI